MAGKVRVRDISATGIGMTFTQPLTKNQRFVIQLDSSKDGPIWLVCLTAYCRPGVGSYTVGARIKQVMRAEEIAKIETQTGTATTMPIPTPAPVQGDMSDIARISKAILG
jgi:hypothetical protein